MKFSNITKNFYPSDIHYNDHPAVVIDVTEEEFYQAMNRAPDETLDVIDGRLAIIPAPPPSLEQIKKSMWNLIQAERDRRKAGGVKVCGYWIHSDDASRIQHMALFMKGDSIPAGLWWKTMSGEFVIMTPELATDIFNAIVDSDQQIFAIAEQHKAAMQMSDDPAEYDFSQGWPETYEPI